MNLRVVALICILLIGLQSAEGNRRPPCVQCRQCDVPCECGVGCNSCKTGFCQRVVNNSIFVCRRGCPGGHSCTAEGICPTTDED